MAASCQSPCIEAATTSDRNRCIDDDHACAAGTCHGAAKSAAALDLHKPISSLGDPAQGPTAPPLTPHCHCHCQRGLRLRGHGGGRRPLLSGSVTNFDRPYSKDSTTLVQPDQSRQGSTQSKRNVCPRENSDRPFSHGSKFVHSTNGRAAQALTFKLYSACSARSMNSGASCCRATCSAASRS